jgi:hypothetical protein
VPDSIQPRSADRVTADGIQAEQQAVLAELAVERFGLAAGTTYRAHHRELAAARHLACTAENARTAADSARVRAALQAPGRTAGVAW